MHRFCLCFSLSLWILMCSSVRSLSLSWQLPKNDIEIFINYKSLTLVYTCFPRAYNLNQPKFTNLHFIRWLFTYLLFCMSEFPHLHVVCCLPQFIFFLFHSLCRNPAYTSYVDIGCSVFYFTSNSKHIFRQRNGHPNNSSATQ